MAGRCAATTRFDGSATESLLFFYRTLSGFPFRDIRRDKVLIPYLQSIAALNGSQTPQQALADAEQKVTEILKKG